MHLNHYSGVHNQAIEVTPEEGAIFVHGRTGTLYNYQEEVEGFINANGEAYIGFWEVEKASVIPPSRTLPLPADLAAYPLEHFIVGGFSPQILHRECQQVQLRSRMSSSLR